MIRQVVPRNARSKRAVAKKEPKVDENPKTTLFLRGSTASECIQSAITDLHSLKKPLAIRFTKKNAIHPFEDVSSLEFFSEKNDASMIVFGTHSKKRPHCLTFVRTFDHKVLDMLELYINRDTFRSLSEFKSAKCAVGLKPLVCFAGTPFENPVADSYTLARSMLLDFFQGTELPNVDVEGLRYIVSISAGEEPEGDQGPMINLRVYLINTRRSGQKTPRVEVEEMGPRIDFRIGRVREADPTVIKEALRRPKSQEACYPQKQKKNIETDIMGDKQGRIHLGRQNLDLLQARKMKGLKRSRHEEDDEEEGAFDAMELDDTENEVLNKRIKGV